MTIKHQIEIETTSFVAVAAFLGIFFVWRSNEISRQQPHLVIPIVAENKTQTVIVPNSNPILKIDTASQISPDGTKMLIMKTTHNANGTLTYVFTTTDESGANSQQIYKTIVKGSENMSIPFNTWSPDNKYLFIQKNGDNALVFKASGEPIVSDQTYFDVSDLFKAQAKKDILSRVTGWASPTLLIINTITEDNTKGSSYWFEVPTKAIIQLATQF